MIQIMIQIFKSVYVAVLLLVLAPMVSAQGLEKVRTFSQTNYPGFVQFVAKELGLFKKYGIDPDLRFFPSGAPIVQAAAAKEWDIAFLGAPPAVIGSTSLGLVTVGIITDNPYEHQLIGRAQYVANTLANPGALKGAKIFVTTLSTGHQMVEGCLRKFGLSSKDVAIIPSEQAATVAAFQAGQGDLAQVWSPFNDALRERGNRILCDGGQAGLHILTVWVAAKDFADKRPELVVRWIKANGDAVKWIKEDLARTTEMYRRFMALAGQNADGAALKGVIDAVMQMKTLEEQMGYMRAMNGARSEADLAYQGIAEFFVRNGRMKEVPDFRPYIDASFLQRAIHR